MVSPRLIYFFRKWTCYLSLIVRSLPLPCIHPSMVDTGRWYAWGCPGAPTSWEEAATRDGSSRLGVPGLSPVDPFSSHSHTHSHITGDVGSHPTGPRRPAAVQPSPPPPSRPLVPLVPMVLGSRPPPPVCLCPPSLSPRRRTIEETLTIEAPWPTPCAPDPPLSSHSPSISPLHIHTHAPQPASPGTPSSTHGEQMLLEHRVS